MLGLAQLAQRRPVFCALLGAMGLRRSQIFQVLNTCPMFVGGRAQLILGDIDWDTFSALRLAWERGA